MAELVRADGELPVMRDGKYQLMAKFHPAPVGDPVDDIYNVARDLADLGNLDPGEARIILEGIDDLWKSGIDLATIDRIAQWASNQSKIDRTGGIRDELREHIDAQLSGEYALAPWPWTMLTRESRSLMPGSVTVVCGAPGAAKSWFVLSCLRYWIEHGHEASVLMLEETVKWHLNRALAQCAGNANLLRPEWVQANRSEAEAIWKQHRESVDLVKERLTCDGNWTMAKCAEWVEDQCKRGKRIVIVDPISLADNGSDKPWEADRKFMARAKVAVEKHGVSLVLVTHPRKQQGKLAGPPQLDDMAGGAAYGRACASTIWISGINDAAPIMVVSHDGVVSQAVPHKMMQVMKARNATGVGKRIVYQFRGLAFDELGEVAAQASQPKPERKRRAKQLPDASEDAFAG